MDGMGGYLSEEQICTILIKEDNDKIMLNSDVISKLGGI